jgi:hypothetical protein
VRADRVIPRAARVQSPRCYIIRVFPTTNSLKVRTVFAPERTLLRWTLPLALAVLALPARASDPRFQLYDGPDGATCKYFNAGAWIPWRHPLGDWRDARGEAQGEIPFAKAVIEAGPGPRVIEWDVTDLVRGWAAGTYPNSGLLLAPVEGTRPVTFSSRESAESQPRPRLTIRLADSAQPRIFFPTADTWLDCSTSYSLGTRSELRVGGGGRTAIQFDLSALDGQRITQATLVLTTLPIPLSAVTIGVFRLDPPVSATVRGPHSGIAAGYRRDIGIERDPDVLLATGFESRSWRADWSYVSPVSHVDRIDRDDKGRFEPFIGHALRVEIAKDDNFGLDMGFDFKAKLGYEPEEIYFRYYLRFADDWDPTVDGGKLPGLAGTYGKAGWGGRKADPSGGWSMRGQFNRAPSAANPLHGHTTIGTYAYHAAMEDEFGDHWYWIRDGIGVLERNRWYCIEQYFRVNTPGSPDGSLRGWIDGALAFEKDDVYVRDVPSLKIERVWMNVYHGGTETAARAMHLYIDNVVVARKPIGCLND